MPLTYIKGDPLLTNAQVLAFGHNRRGRTEMSNFTTSLMRRETAAFSTFTRQCRKGRLSSGEYWMWRESKPYLMFMVVRDSSVGATRLRYVQSIAMRIARDYRLEGFKSVAIAPLGIPMEWTEIKLVLEAWFAKSKLPIVVYDEYIPGVQAEEPNV